jgi:signal transduction histidine kinase
MLLVFYVVTSWAASRGIAPVNQLILETQRIGNRNISNRIPLPSRHDEIHQLASTINELLGRIEVSLTREKQITADISHELRTPLTGIRGILEVLIRKTREPEKYEEKIRQVIGEVDTLNRIIDQLLQLSRLDAGNLMITQTQVDIGRLMQIIKEKWKQQLDEKKVLLQIDIPGNTKVSADQGFLEIMLENIVSNAIKYGNSGQQVLVSWDGAEHTLSVTDTGQVIPSDQIAHIFDRFYRTDDSRTSQVPGTGLGLSIVKNLAEIQNIGITASSGKETVFSLRFNS